jgi:hypothetical protein
MSHLAYKEDENPNGNWQARSDEDKKKYQLANRKFNKNLKKL